MDDEIAFEVLAEPQRVLDAVRLIRSKLGAPAELVRGEDEDGRPSWRARWDGCEGFPAETPLQAAIDLVRLFT